MKKIVYTLLIALCSISILNAQKTEKAMPTMQGLTLFSPTPVLFWAIAFDKEATAQVAENQTFAKQKQSKWSAFKQKAKQYKWLMGLLGFGGFALLANKMRKMEKDTRKAIIWILVIFASLFITGFLLGMPFKSLLKAAGLILLLMILLWAAMNAKS